MVKQKHLQSEDLTLTRDDAQPIYLQVCTRFKTAILEGRFAPGERVPSVRTLASELGLSRGTVNLAYQVLAEEGYLEFRGTAGTFVDTRLATSTPRHLTLPAAPRGEDLAEQSRGPPPLQLGLPALDAFPRKTWNRLVSRHSRQIAPNALAYPDPAGLMALRKQVAAYLSFSRGIACRPEQVFVTSGHRATLDLIIRTLYQPGDEMWFEDPGYRVARHFLLSIGAKLHPIPVDHDGLIVKEGRLRAPHARFAVVTPANQSPLGVMMTMGRRAELLEWAEDGRWIVEDDYDSEFRYNRRPPLSLKAMDHGQRVLFAGSFSKVLYPGLRLAYLVVPPSGIAAFETNARVLNAGCPEFHQAVVCDFMEQGYFIRHLKRMRTLYSERRQFLADALQEAFGDGAQIVSPPAGLHLVLQLREFQRSYSEIVAQARTEDLGLQSLSSWHMGAEKWTGLLLGFTNVANRQAAHALTRRLRDICDAVQRCE